jgi:hypothetical protein
MAAAHRPSLGALALFLGACSGGDAAPAVGSASGAPVAVPAPAAPAWFREEARERGLVFEHDSGARPERYLMPEIMCGGAALVDVDLDGDLDAYLVQAGDLAGPAETRPPNQLFRNDGAGRFADITDGSGAGDRGFGMGVACGDADQDGRVDLYVTNTGPNTLLVNLDGAHFADRTAAAGVGDPGFGSSAGFLDYDRDGDLDLFTLNYLHWSLETELDCFNGYGSPDYCSPQTYDSPTAAVLYRNRGDGTFDDATALLGIDRSVGCGLGLASGDFNGDGREDIFVANDGTPSHLWVQQADGSFKDEAFFAGCAVDQDGRPKAGMGVAVGDLDEDGDLDLLICNLANQTDSLYRNEGRAFRDSTAIAGLGMASRPFTRFGQGWVDFDHDGQLDLYQANGRVNRQTRTYSEDPFAEPSLLLRGDGERFAEVEPRGGTDPLLIATSRAAAFGDVNGDAAVDILVVNRDAPARLLINAVARPATSVVLSVVLEDGAPALGARVELTRAEKRLVRDVRAAFSYQASNDPRVHVGLGGAQGVENVVVTWWDGRREAFGSFPAGSIATLKRGAGTPAE